jgi:phosphoglycerate dehydrogenase-like enzyme
VEVTAFTEHQADSEELVAALADVDIVVVMRERTPLPAPVFAGLPRLRLVVTTGMRNSAIDLPAAAHGVLVCGTASSPSRPPS